jgi:hypothetical protein
MCLLTVVSSHLQASPPQLMLAHAVAPAPPPPQNVEANISSLHQRLQITPAREAQFDTLANVTRRNARAETTAQRSPSPAWSSASSAASRRPQCCNRPTRRRPGTTAAAGVDWTGAHAARQRRARGGLTRQQRSASIRRLRPLPDLRVTPPTHADTHPIDLRDHRRRPLRGGHQPSVRPRDTGSVR